jgi:hypothetical protein
MAHGGDNTTWADIPDHVFARAAIEAMREPTIEMVEAGVGQGTTPEIWRAMIDIAKAEAP